MSLELRRWKMDDLNNLVRYADNFEIAKKLRDAFPHPYTREDGISFIELMMKKDIPNVLSINYNGEPVGGIGIHPQTDVHCKNAELGYWLAQPFWGRGIMTDAVMLMIEYGFKHWDINRIYACPFGTNIASQKVLEKAGFILEARFEKTIFKNGEFLDELFYAKRK